MRNLPTIVREGLGNLGHDESVFHRLSVQITIPAREDRDVLSRVVKALDREFQSGDGFVVVHVKAEP